MENGTGDCHSFLGLDGQTQSAWHRVSVAGKLGGKVLKNMDSESDACLRFRTGSI